jgi:hypothetical protein
MITVGQNSNPSRRTIASRENGSEGGRARASRHSGEVLSEWASHGGMALLEKFGPDYFVQLRKRRKNYANPKHSESPVVTPNWQSRAARENGQKGGLARAALYSYEHLREWGRLGGIETWTRYGNKFYREIRKKRKYYQKNYRKPKTIRRLEKYCERMARKEQGSVMGYAWKWLAEQFASQISPRSRR